MVYDCFTYYNEEEILRLRLKELWSVVDKFVLVEANKTHSGLEKPLLFEENKSKFAEFLDKIIHVKVEDMPTTGDAWVRENFQRNAISRGIESAQPEDWILISDVDEIIRASKVEELKTITDHDQVGFNMPIYYFKLNFCSNKHDNWAAASRKRSLSSPQEIRNGRSSFHPIPNGGWHFSYLGDEDFVRNKIRSFAHQEYNTAPVLSSVDISSLIREKKDIYGRHGFNWEVKPIDYNYPKEVVENIDLYFRWIEPL